MQSLIENATRLNGGQKVALWAFSGGPQWTLAFLHRMSQQWKEAHISWFVATSPVWGGVPEALSSYIAGTAAAAVHPNATEKLGYGWLKGTA